jgi:hypothetical protein
LFYRYVGISLALVASFYLMPLDAQKYGRTPARPNGPERDEAIVCQRVTGQIATDSSRNIEL